MPKSREEIMQGLYDNTLWGKAPPVVELTKEGLELGLTPTEILFQALIPALEDVGRRFEIGEFFVPEMLIAARAMQGSMNILKPLMVETGLPTVGKFVMMTVKGDMHDIGKNLCNIMLEAAGFKVIDLGVNVAPATLIKAVQDNEPDLVGFSAFLTTTMPMFKINIQTLHDAGWRDKVKVMVGGAPVTPEYAEKSGADGYAKDASQIVRVAKKLIGKEDVETAAPSSELAAAAKAIENMMKKADEEH
ncbi:MAG: corrinoid protein [Chloroflexi bacterium]|nr:corrinoid protein [Chloroflexota bacterium]